MSSSSKCVTFLTQTLRFSRDISTDQSMNERMNECIASRFDEWLNQTYVATLRNVIVYGTQSEGRATRLLVVAVNSRDVGLFVGYHRHHVGVDEHQTEATTTISHHHTASSRPSSSSHSDSPLSAARPQLAPPVTSRHRLVVKVNTCRQLIVSRVKMAANRLRTAAIAKHLLNWYTLQQRHSSYHTIWQIA